MKRRITILIVALIAPLCAFAEVTIIREPPSSPANRTDAVWNAPAGAQIDSSKGGGDIAGRVKAGGSMEQSGSGLSYNISTDSSITYSHTGSRGTSSYLAAEAYRRDALALDEQRYELRGGVAGGRLGFDISAGYDTSDKVVADASRYGQSIAIGTEINALFIPSLPIVLSADVESGLEREDSASIAENSKMDIGLAANGALGNIDVQLAGDAELSGDQVSKVEESVAGAQLQLGFPLSELFTIQMGVGAHATKTRYYELGNINELLIANGSVGGVLTPNVGDTANLLIRLAAIREDTWPSQEGPLQDPSLEEHIALWGAETGITFDSETGFYARPSYSFGWSTTDVLSHDISAATGWASPQDDAVIAAIGAEGQITLSTNLNGAVLSDQKNWGTSLALKPVEGMSISTGYQGSERRDDDVFNWAHEAVLDMDHDVHGLLQYGISGEVDLQLAGQSIEKTSQDYSAHISASPPIGSRTITAGLSEDFNLVTTDLSNEKHSLFEGTLDVPLARAISAGYGFQWEWAALDEGENSGHAFRHEGRVTLSGDGVPLDLTVRYALSHGYRGTRHDGETLLTIPIGKDFRLENRFNVEYDVDNPAESVPYLIELSLGYVF